MSSTYQGNAPLIETPELLTSAVKELDDELAKVPNNKKKWFATALERAPELCDVVFKLKHLRYELFNVEVSKTNV